MNVQAKLAAPGPRVIPRLIYRLVHGAEDHAHATIGVFRSMKERARPAVPTLMALLEDSPLPVRLRALVRAMCPYRGFHR